jgi:uncharacterized membrane protein
LWLLFGLLSWISGQFLTRFNPYAGGGTIFTIMVGGFAIFLFKKIADQFPLNKTFSLK